MPLLQDDLQQSVQNMAQVWAADLSLTPYLVSGDPYLAFIQSVSAELQWVQSQIAQTYAFARAATATEADLDSWMADYNFPRESAIAATGTVTFSLAAVNANNINIPVGTVIQVAGGAIQYAVVADSTQVGYVPGQSAYVILAGNTTVNATVQAVVPGQASNVQPATLVQFVTSLGYVNSVSNGSAINNGEDAESDISYRARFPLYLGSLSKGTLLAYQSTILDYNASMNFVVLENTNVAGTTQVGQNLVVIDDGSGATPDIIVAAVAAALENIRPLGIQINVIKATVTTTTIALNIKVGPNGVASVVESNVKTAIIDYVSALRLGSILYANKIIQIACDADPNVVSVQVGSLYLNGSAIADTLIPAYNKVLKATTGSVTVASY